MYDSLEGLDYEEGECSYYVSLVLADISKSLDNGDMVRMKANKVKVGDVVVGNFSSYLVTTDDYYPRVNVTEKDATIGRKESSVLVIPNEVLRQKQTKYKSTRSSKQ